MNQTIYIKLLDEGVNVWRPVAAKQIRNDNSFMILLPPYNSIPLGENWEFEPGTLVLTKEVILDGNLVRVAYKKID